MNHKDRIGPERRLRVLSDLIRVAASSLDIRETFEAVGERIKELIDYDRLAFAFYNPGDDSLFVDAITGSNTEGRIRVPLHSSSVGEAVLTGRPILLSNFPEDSPYEVSKLVSDSAELHSVMYIPLESKGRVIGVLCFFAFQRGQYAQYDLDLAEEIGSYVAIIAEHTLTVTNTPK